MVTLALLVVLLLCTAVDAKPNCDECLKAGYPYLCKATINSGICFQDSGDAQCDGDGCTCCRKKATSGCVTCEEDDGDEDDTD